MSDFIYKIIFIALFVIGVTIAYWLGRTKPMNSVGSIDITDSDEPDLQGKVTFIFNEEIEELIKHKYVTLTINNYMTLKKYNHDNEEH